MKEQTAVEIEMSRKELCKVVEMRARCTSCRTVWTMNNVQKLEAKDCGCAMSPCCMAPATIESVKTKRGGR